MILTQRITSGWSRYQVSRHFSPEAAVLSRYFRTHVSRRNDHTDQQRENVDTPGKREKGRRADEQKRARSRRHVEDTFRVHCTGNVR